MNIFKRFVTSPAGNAALVSLFAFVVYLKTLAPSVTFIDSGELAAVACTLGVAHPTGYPLFTLLGWAFSKLPIASEEIVRLNMMAAFFCAAGVYTFYHLAHFVFTGILSRSSVLKFRKKEQLSVAVRVSSAGASLLLAFSETYWSQAVSIEVYSLHVLFLSVVSYVFMKAIFDDEWNPQETTTRTNGWWYLFAFLLGLSFTNHMTTILLAPGFLYLYFATQGAAIDSWKRILRMVVPFFAGFSVYLYLPFRATTSPALNWGNPVTLEKFLWHWTGKQYRVWIFSSTEAAGRQLKYFMESLPFESAYVGLVLAIVGIILLWRANKQIAIGVVLLFLGCAFYSINYDIHDIDSYFLLAYWCVALIAGVGLIGLFRWLSGKMNVVALTFLFLAVSLLPLYVHYNKTDETQNYLVEDYTKNMFASLEPGALVLSYQWDYWVSASFYYQFVKDFRPDVAVVDKELLRRSWYFVELGHRYPWLIESSRAEVDAFLRELYKFEHDLPYDSRIIEASYVSMIRSFIVKSIQSRPVYVTAEIENEFTGGLQRVPEGLAQRVYADTLQHEVRVVNFSYRDFSRAGRLEDGIKSMYANALYAQALRLVQGGRDDMAIDVLKKSLLYNPNSAETNSLLTQLSLRRR